MKYHVASAIGLFPAQLINIYLGSSLRSMQDVLEDRSTATTGYIVFAFQVSTNYLNKSFLIIIR